MFPIVQDSIEISKSARLKGNEFYKSDKLIAAIAQYNKALVFAGDDKKQAALCYGNRSAVYLKLNYFQHCLHNIDLAEPNYLAHKIQKLRDRRKECLKMMKKKTDKAMKPFDYPAKLSYKPNPKIPFFIDALQLRDDPVNGKHIITTRDLKAGDIIGMFEPWRIPVNDPMSDYKLACYNCLNTNNGDLIPGKDNVVYPPLFCSKKCLDEHLIMDKDHEGVNEFEGFYRFTFETSDPVATSLIFVHKVFLEFYDAFGSVEAMRMFYESREKLNYSFFDFDWSMLEDDLKYQENMLLVIMSVLGNLTSTGASMCIAAMIQRNAGSSKSRLIEIRKKQNHKNGKFMDQLLDCIHEHTRFSLKMNFALSNNFSAVLIHPSIKSFSKSCDANIIMHHETHDGSKKIIFIVNQPISAGEMVTIPAEVLYYRSDFDLNVKNCTKVKEFCTPCRENWATMIKKENILEDMMNNVKTFFKHKDPRKVDSMLKHRREICNFINENFTDYYENPETRYKIATKKGELQMNLNMMGNPTPQVNPSMYHEPDFYLNAFRFMLSDSHELS